MENNQRFGARVAHRIKMTKKINREAKERHAAERHGSERQVRVTSRSRQTKRKTKTMNEKLDFFHWMRKFIFLVRKLDSFIE